MDVPSLALGGSADARPGLREWLAAELRGSRLLYLILLGFFTGVAALAAWFGESIVDYVMTYAVRAGRAILLLACAALANLAVRSLIQREEASPLRFVATRLFSRPSRHLFMQFAFACGVLAAFMGAFLYAKTLIPDIAPFSWDPVFVEWDRYLFLGHTPWTVLQPLLGYPPVTIALDLLYSAWVPLVFVVWAGALISPRVSPALRRRYWLATMLSWILIGVAMATALSSAGPCFTPELFPDLAAEFGGLNAYLASIDATFPLSSALSKDYLWDVFTLSSTEPGGISAMPSMHNAQTVLFTLLGYSVNRRLGHLMLAYAVLIFLGSIHLAWHYAVDGLIGGAAALAIWWVAGLVYRDDRITARA